MAHMCSTGTCGNPDGCIPIPAQCAATPFPNCPKRLVFMSSDVTLINHRLLVTNSARLCLLPSEDQETSGRLSELELEPEFPQSLPDRGEAQRGALSTCILDCNNPPTADTLMGSTICRAKAR